MGKMEQLLQKINSKTNGDFEVFLINHGICPLCAGEIKTRVVQEGHTKVCVTCGLEPKLFSTRHIPSLTAYTPSNKMSYGDGRGGTLQRKGTFQVLCQQQGVVNAARHIAQVNMLVKTVDHPKIMTLLRYGSQRMKEWFPNQSHSDPRSVAFSNILGERLRQIGSHYLATRQRRGLKHTADACFALTLKEMYGDEHFNEAVEKFGVTPEYLEKVARLYYLLTGAKK